MRIDKATYFMKIAEVVSMRATCLKKQVGCVLVDAQSHIIATGYNGQPANVQHCDEKSPCLASTDPLISCQAIHAEMNALMQCSDITKIDKIYCTHYPCDKCMMMICNTGCKTLIYLNGPDEVKQVTFVKPRIVKFGVNKDAIPPV